MRNLSLRLTKICECAQNSKRIADVGCDHGKVLEYLIENGNPQFVVASDISAPSAEKAKKLLTKQNKVKFSVRVGNGFSTLKKEDNLDTIIVAGMGGLEIINILSNSEIKVPKLILQPQNNVVKLREYLNKSNYVISSDFVVKQKHMFYTILVVTPGCQTLTDLQLKYGVFVLSPTPEQNCYLKFLLDKLTQCKNQVSGAKREQITQQIQEINSLIRKED